MLGIDLDKIKETVTNSIKHPEKAGSSFSKAFGEAWNAKWGKKWEVFKDKFLEEMTKIGEDKKEISADAQKKAENVVNEVMKDPTKAVNLDESKVEKDSAKTYKEVLAVGVASLDAKQKPHLIESVKKLTKALKEGKSDSLDGDEFRAIGGVVLMALKDLKNRYPEKDKLEAAMKQIADVSVHTDYPLKDILTSKIWGILNPGIVTGISLADDLGVSAWEMPGFKMDMALMKEKELKPKDEQTLCDTMHKYILPHTSEANIKKIIGIIRSVSPKEGSDKVSGALPFDKLAEIVHIVHVDDFVRLIKVFTGKTVPAKTQ